MNENDVKKQLLKSRVNAKFSHYISGNLYYTVELEDGTYQFPIQTVETVSKHIVDEGIFFAFNLSSDLGTTSFYNEMRGSELNRWISKAIKSETFVKIA